VSEPRRTSPTDATEEVRAVGRQLEADAPAVIARSDAAEQPCALEPVDVRRERRSGDPLQVSQLTERQPGVLADEPEEGGLTAGDAERLRLLVKLACQTQEDRAQPFGRVGDIDSFSNH